MTSAKDIGDTKHLLRTAATISEAVPYIRQFAGSTFVVKYGGHAMGDAALTDKFARDMILLEQVGIHPVVVHGGGPQIGQMLERLKIKSSFVDGLRVTDQTTVEIVEMVLAGSINKEIANAINKAGGKAVGISGKDARLLEVRKLARTKVDPESNIEKVLDLGFVGEPERVNPEILHLFGKSDIIPVVAPIGVDADGQTYNVNADTAAGAIAGALLARKLILLTDVPGVLDAGGKLVSRIGAREAHAMLESGTITGGMIPKLETCLKALADGVEAVHILDGRVPHVVLLEIFTEHGTGTMIVRDEAAAQGPAA